MDGEWEPPMVENPICKEIPGCGPWSAPMIENPKFKGKWKPPMIDNPNYKGKWVPKKIPNPDYYYDDAPLKASPIVRIFVVYSGFQQSSRVLIQLFRICYYAQITEPCDLIGSQFDLWLIQVDRKKK